MSETLSIKTADRRGAHLYTTSYVYDRNGRRTWLTAPGAFSGGPMTYGYDPLWGALTSVSDILSTVQQDSLRLLDGDLVQTTVTTGSHRYDALGRLDTLLLGANTTAYSYDAAGNQYFQRTTLGANVPRERAAYYGADERLVATESQVTGKRTLEEYRYDALRRRVWVRRLTRCQPTSAIECITANVRRTIWDGSQELAEIQATSAPA